MRKQSSTFGYTLIELLLYVSMIGILLSAVTVFFGITADARVKNQTISEINDQGAYAMDYIAQTIRNASSVSSPAVGASGSSLTLTVPTGSLSPSVFALSNGVLQITEGTNAAVALTSSKLQATAFTVKNLSRSGTPGLIQVSLTLVRVNPAGRNEYDYQRTFITSAALRP